MTRRRCDFRSRAALLAVVLALPAVEAFGHGNPQGEAKAAVAGKAVSITYGRPSLKGRDLASLLPPDHLWRMGADVPTTLKTDAELRFGPVVVPPGTYHVIAKRLASGGWIMLIFTPTTRWVWDLPRPHRVSDMKVVAEVPLTQSTVAESVELMTIELRGEGHRGEFQLTWGTLVLRASFMGW